MPPVKNNDKKVKGPKGGKWFKKLILVAVLVACAVIFFINPSASNSITSEVSYSTFLTQSIEATDYYVNPVDDSSYEVIAVMENGDKLITTVNGDSQLATINELALDNNIELTNGLAPKETNWGTIVMWVCIVGIVGLVIWGSVSMVKSTFSGLQGMSGGAGGKGGNPNDMTKSKAQLIEDTNVTLDQVAGIDDEKEDILEIIDMIKNSEKYVKAGAELPKGIMLSGGPGCGR